MGDLESKSGARGTGGAITYLGVFASGGRQSSWMRNGVETDGLLALIENGTAERVLACIGPQARGVEELGSQSGLPTALLLGTLMKLELAGRVTCLPGKRYILR